MTTHATDIAHVIREALIGAPMVGWLSELRTTPNPDASFPNRDGRLEFVCAPQDCVRGFRVTVEAISLREALSEDVANAEIASA